MTIFITSLLQHLFENTSETHSSAKTNCIWEKHSLTKNLFCGTYHVKFMFSDRMLQGLLWVLLWIFLMCHLTFKMFATCFMYGFKYKECFRRLKLWVCKDRWQLSKNMLCSTLCNYGKQATFNMGIMQKNTVYVTGREYLKAALSWGWLQMRSSLKDSGSAQAGITRQECKLILQNPDFKEFSANILHCKWRGCLLQFL